MSLATEPSSPWTVCEHRDGVTEIVRVEPVAWPDLDFRPARPGASRWRYGTARCACCGLRVTLPTQVFLPGTGEDNPEADVSRLPAPLSSVPELPELSAAWEADDAGEAATAASHRRRAAAVVAERVREKRRLLPEAGADLLLLVDLLRRSAQPEAAAVVLARARPQAPRFLQRLLDFERHLLARADSRRHAQWEVLPLLPSA